MLQRESLINTQEDRVQVQQISQSLGNALDDLNTATAPVVPLLKGLTMGNNSGEFSFSTVKKESESEQAKHSTGPALFQSKLQNVSEALNSKPKGSGPTSPEVLMNQTVKEVLKSSG